MTHIQKQMSVDLEIYIHSFCAWKSCLTFVFVHFQCLSTSFVYFSFCFLIIIYVCRIIIIIKSIGIDKRLTFPPSIPDREMFRENSVDLEVFYDLCRNVIYVDGLYISIACTLSCCVMCSFFFFFFVFYFFLPSLFLVFF